MKQEKIKLKNKVYKVKDLKGKESKVQDSRFQVDNKDFEVDEEHDYYKLRYYRKIKKK